MLRAEESPSDCTPDLIAYIHALYTKIPQAIILSTVRPLMYLAGVKVGSEYRRARSPPSTPNSSLVASSDVASAGPESQADPCASSGRAARRHHRRAR